MRSPSTVTRNLRLLDSSLERSREWLDSGQLSLRVDGVSHWSVAQQLDHIVLVLRANLKAVWAILNDEPGRVVDGPRPGFLARMILWLGWIPRGRAVAPDIVVPEPEPEVSAIVRVLEEVEEQARGLRSEVEAIAATRGRILHPVLGAFTAAQWVRFAHIHVDHHLAIIRDISRARPSVTMK